MWHVRLPYVCPSVCVRVCVCLSTWRCSSRRTTCRALERALKQPPPPPPPASSSPPSGLPFPFSRRRASSLCRLFNYILAKGSSVEKAAQKNVRTQRNKNEVEGAAGGREKSAGQRGLLSKVPLLVIDMCLMSAFYLHLPAEGEMERWREWHKERGRSRQLNWVLGHSQLPGKSIKYNAD